jgi:hypothetical protein
MTKTKKKQSEWECKGLVERFRKRELHAWHIGLLLAAYNTLTFAVFCIIAIVAYWYVSLWLYLILILPVFYTFFWLWCGQHVRNQYPSLTLHQTLVIAKFSVIPFIILFVFSLLNLALLAMTGETVTTSSIGIVLYDLALISCGSIFLGMTMIVISLGVKEPIHHFFRRK